MHFFMYGHTVSAKSQQASVKTPVQVEFPVFAISKQSKATIKKEHLKTWLCSKSCQFVNNKNISHQISS